MAPRIDQRVNTVSAAQYLKFSAELVTAERDIRKKTEDLAAARGIKAGIFRRAKDAGADVEAMKHLRLLAKMEDEERNRLLETVNKYADWEGVTLWVGPTDEKPQGALFGDDPAAATAQQGLVDARVTSDAFNSRRSGADIGRNPHPPSSRNHQTWDQAWRDADADIKLNPQSAPPVKASTAKKPAKAKATPPGDEGQKRGPGRPRKVPLAIAGPVATPPEEPPQAAEAADPSKMFLN